MAESSHSRWPRRLLVLGLLLLLTLAGALIGCHLWVEYHFHAAQQDANRLQFALAREHLRLCLKIGPRSYRAHYLAAQTARRAGDYEVAEQHLDECQCLVGANPEIRLERALLEVQQGELDGLDAQLHALVDQGHPDTLLILEALTKGFLSTRRFNEALACLKLWLARQPDDTQALSMHAWIYAENHKYPHAIADYEHILRVDPDNEKARLNLADSLLRAKRPYDALPHLERLHDRLSASPAVLAGLARCYQDTGKHQEAKRLYEELLSQQPNHSMALMGRGKVALAEGHPEEAETYLRRAVEVDPSFGEAHYTLYLCLVQAGKTQEAERQQAKLREVERDLHRFFELMNKEISQRPQDPKLLCEAGILSLRYGEHKAGLQWLYRALKYDPHYADAHQVLADYYERNGDPGRASQYRKLASPAPGSSAEAGNAK
jgi:tetratricopeptide (TPR) repeat protein